MRHLRTTPLLSSVLQTLALVGVVALGGCVDSEPFDEELEPRADETHTFLVCDAEPPVPPGAVGALVHARFPMAWAATQEAFPELQQATPEQRMAVEAAVVHALELRAQDLAIGAPAEGCIVDCRVDSRTIEEVELSGDQCLAGYDVHPDAAEASFAIADTIWQLVPEAPHCMALRAAAVHLSNIYGTLATTDCTGCSAEELRELDRAADAAMAALREIARLAAAMGCSPPANWIMW